MEHFPKDVDFEIEMTIETTNSENGNLLLRVDANTFEISIGENSFNFMKKNKPVRFDHVDETAGKSQI